MQTYDTLSEAISDLQTKGYTTDFNLAFDQIKCSASGKCLLPSEFEIVSSFRFEGMTDPDDSSVLYVIESTDGAMKGTLVNAYGVYSDGASDDMIRKLAVNYSQL